MPDIYGNIAPSDSVEVQSTDNIRTPDLRVQMPSISRNNNQSSKPQLNDLDRLMFETDKSISSQDWSKSEIYNNPIINTPFKFTTRYLDPDIGFDATDKDLEVKYGENQGVLSRVFNRLTKTGATAAVSFTETLASALDLLSGREKTGTSAANDWLEKLDSEILPNYQTQYQKDHPLLSYLPNPFAMKSWLDNVGKITQNLGYTIGAMGAAAVIDIPVAAMTDGLGEIPLLARQSSKIFSSIGKLSRIFTSAGEEYNAYRKAIDSGEDVLKAIATAADIKKGTNTLRFLNSSVMSAYGESMMEADGIYRDTKKNLESQFLDEYGNYNGGEENAKNIEQASKDAAQVGLKANMAFLSVSNMFGLGTILRPGAAAIRATEKSLAKEVTMRLSKDNINVFEFIPNEASALKGFFKSASKPLSLVGNNVKEALEEGYQTGVQEAAQNYYTRKFNAGANNVVNNFSDSIGDAFTKVFTTTEGQESMLMGLLGGVIQGGIGSKFQSKQGILKGAKLAESITNNLNSVNVTSLFDPNRAEAVTSAQIANEMQEASKTGDLFKYKNLQHQQLFNLVDTSVKSNKFQLRVEQLQALKSLSDEDFKTLFNLELNEENSKTVNEYVDGLISKANEIKQQIERVDTVFGTNPYPVKSQNRLIFDNYKSELALTLSEQKDHLRRAQQIKNSISSTLPAIDMDQVTNMSSELGIQETLTRFKERVVTLKKSETQSEGNSDLIKSFRPEREFLEKKIIEIEEAVANDRSKQKDFLGTINSIYNYYANGNTPIGDSDISRMDALRVYNDSYDINRLKDNTERIKRYYKELTSKNGFNNFAKDFGRRINAFEDRIRVKDGKLVVLTDEQLDEEFNQAQAATEEANKPSPIDEVKVKETLGIKDIEDGKEKIKNNDKEIIAKLYENSEEEGEDSTANKIRDGRIPITEELKEEAAKRLDEELVAPVQQEDVPMPDEGAKEFQPRGRKERIQKAMKERGISDSQPTEEDDEDINSLMPNPARRKVTEEELATKDAEVPMTPLEKFWDRFLFKLTRMVNKMVSKDFTDAKYKTNLHNLIFKGGLNKLNNITVKVSPSTNGKTTSDLTSIDYIRETTKGQMDIRQFPNMFRTGYSTDVVVYADGVAVGVMTQPTSLVFKRGTEVLPISQISTAKEYAEVTLNPEETFEKFKKDYGEYEAAYNQLVGDGAEKTVDNETFKKLFVPLVSFGSIQTSGNAADSTVINKLEYRGKGDAILSFPIELNEETGKYERTKIPIILNQAELTDDEITETLVYIANNVDRIQKNIDGRYIYLMRMPDGKFNKQSPLRARPVDEAKPNLENYLDDLKKAVVNEDSESIKKINATLGEDIYIAHKRGTRRTNARFSLNRKKEIVLTIYNNNLGVIQRIPFPRAEMLEQEDFEQFLGLVNRKISAAEKRNRGLENLKIDLEADSFKKSLSNDSEITLDELESRLAVSVKPNVFRDSSITFLPNTSNAKTEIKAATRTERTTTLLTPKQVKKEKAARKRDRSKAAIKREGLTDEQYEEAINNIDAEYEEAINQIDATVEDIPLNPANAVSGKTKAVKETGDPIKIATIEAKRKEDLDKQNEIYTKGLKDLEASNVSDIGKKAEREDYKKIHKERIKKINDKYNAEVAEVNKGIDTYKIIKDGKVVVTGVPASAVASEVENVENPPAPELVEAPKAAQTRTLSNLEVSSAKIVNDNINSIITQLKDKGILKTDC